MRLTHVAEKIGGRYIGRGRTRYKYHVTEWLLMRMRVTLADEEVGNRYIGRGRTRYKYHVTEGF
jgi:hypothetical protein